MKTDDLHLRIDPERKALFRKRAEEMNLNISQYFEHLMDEKPMIPALLDKEITRLRDELHYANNNLNQVAHALNGTYYHFPDDAEKVDKVIEQMNDITMELMNYLKEIRQYGNNKNDVHKTSKKR